MVSRERTAVASVSALTGEIYRHICILALLAMRRALCCPTFIIALVL